MSTTHTRVIGLKKTASHNQILFVDKVSKFRIEPRFFDTDIKAVKMCLSVTSKAFLLLKTF